MLLRKLAFQRGAAELLFNIWDVAERTAKGGVVGAVAEAWKILVERALTDVYPDIEKEAREAFPGRARPGVRPRARARDRQGRPQGHDDASRQGPDQRVDRGAGVREDRVPDPLPAPGGAQPAARHSHRLRAAETLLCYQLAQAEGLLNAFRKGTLRKHSLELGKAAFKAFVTGSFDATNAAWTEYFERAAVANLLYQLYRDYADLW